MRHPDAGPLPTIPEPPVPAEVDLRGMPFMPLYIDRLQKSKAWLLCKRRPELAFFFMNLWMRSWQEVPAASLEDDDDVLADAAMVDHRTWSKVRADALRGWVKCSDGRLYHPVVAELALEAWGQRQAYRERTAKARQARQQRRGSADKEADKENVTDPGTVSVTEAVTALKGEGEGEGEGQGKNQDDDDARVRTKLEKGGAADVFVDEFLRLRELHWSGSDAVPLARNNLRVEAAGLLALEGATVDLLVEVLDERMKRAQASGRSPPRTLRAFGDSLRDAVASAREARAFAATVAQPRARSGGGGRAQAGAEPPPLIRTEDEIWAPRLRGYQASKFWIGQWGDPPGHPSCQAPPALVAEILGGAYAAPSGTA